MSYIITCPICRKQYKLTPKDPQALSQQMFSCPNCRNTAPFSTLIKNLEAPHNQTIQTSTPTKHNVHAATKVRQNPGMQAKAYLSVIGSNAKFVLNQGVYILGRRSSDSQATLQLAPDISMSRQHARLAVQVVGGRLLAQIVGIKANNPVIINGKICVAGQPCTLKPGDRLQLGMTRIVFTI